MLALMHLMAGYVSMILTMEVPHTTKIPNHKLIIRTNLIITTSFIIGIVVSSIHIHTELIMEGSAPF